MSNLQLQGRFLSADEKTLFLGHSRLNVFKALSFDQFIEVFHEVYNGKTPIFADLADDMKYRVVYAYYGEPTGSKYFYERTSEKGSQVFYGYKGDTKIVGNRTELLGEQVNVQYAISKVTEFLVDKVKPLYTKFGRPVPERFSNILRNLNFSYNHTSGIVDLMLSGCIFICIGNKIQSIVSVPAYCDLDPKNTYLADQLGKLRSTEETNKTDYIGYKFFVTPNSVVNYEALEVIATMTTEELLSNYSATMADFKAMTLGSNQLWPVFAWLDYHTMVVSNRYLNLNGYVLINDEPKMKFCDNVSTPYSLTHTQALCSTFNLYMYHKVNDTLENAITVLPFVGADSASKNSWGTLSSYTGALSGPGNFFFVNTDEFNKTKFPNISAKLPILLDIDETFISGLETTYTEILERGGDSSKHRKNEFFLSNDGMGSKAAFENARYDTVSSSDNVFFYQVKTSKARDTAKKTAITRKIGTFMNPVLDWVTSILATDLDTGQPIENRFWLNALNKYLPVLSDGAESLNDDWLASKDTYIAYMNKRVKSASEFTILVDSLYLKQNCESNITEIIKPAGIDHSVSWRYDYKTSKAYLFHKIMSIGIMYSPTNLVGGSNTKLEFIKLGKFLYMNTKKLDYRGRKESFIAGGNYSNQTCSNYFANWEAKVLLNNNLICDDVNLETSINTSGIKYPDSACSYYGDTAIQVRSFFNFSDDSLKIYDNLKKVKTFTDYYNWLNTSMEVIKLKLAAASIGNYSKDIATVYLDYSLAILKHLSEAETKFLPKEEVIVEVTETDSSSDTTEETKKKRTRKSKTTAASVVALSTVSTEEETKNVSESGTAEIGTPNFGNHDLLKLGV